MRMALSRMTKFFDKLTVATHDKFLLPKNIPITWQFLLPLMYFEKYLLTVSNQLKCEWHSVECTSLPRQLIYSN